MCKHPSPNLSGDYMKSHWFECSCFTLEHSFRFTYDEEDNELYLDVFLTNAGWRSRLWQGVKYIFGHKSKYGQHASIIIQEKDLGRLQDLIITKNSYEKLQK